MKKFCSGAMYWRLSTFDFTVHVVDGATGEVGFYLYRQFRVLVFGREMQGVGAEMVDSGTEVEGGCLAGSIDRAVQLYGAVFVVERYVTVEAALLILSVQSDVFVGIVTVVYGCHQFYVMMRGIFGRNGCL